MFLQENITVLHASVAFIMDNVTKQSIGQTEERFPLNVYAEPVINVDVNRVDDYITVWPCTHDRITIKVKKTELGDFFKCNMQDSGAVFAQQCHF